MFYLYANWHNSAEAQADVRGCIAAVFCCGGGAEPGPGEEDLYEEDAEQYLPDERPGSNTETGKDEEEEEFNYMPWLIGGLSILAVILALGVMCLCMGDPEPEHDIEKPRRRRAT